MLRRTPGLSVAFPTLDAFPVVVIHVSDSHIAPFGVNTHDSFVVLFVEVLLLFCGLSNCFDLSHVHMSSCSHVPPVGGHQGSLGATFLGS